MLPIAQFTPPPYCTNQLDMVNTRLICGYLLIQCATWLVLVGFTEGAILKLGTPLLWKDSLSYLRYVRRHGVLQFINKYEKCKDVVCDELLWGDEIEYGVFAYNSDKGTYGLSCRTEEVHPSTWNVYQG